MIPFPKKVLSVGGGTHRNLVLSAFRASFGRPLELFSGEIIIPRSAHNMKTSPICFHVI